MSLASARLAFLGIDSSPADIMAELEFTRIHKVHGESLQDTALIRAAQKGHANGVAVLMMFAHQQGCVDYVYTLDAQGMSALHWAVYKGHTEVVAVMKHIDPLVLMQRTVKGQLPLKLMNRRNYADEKMAQMLRYKKKRDGEGSNHSVFCCEINKRCMLRFDNIAYGLHLLSLVFSFFVAVILGLSGIDNHSTRINVLSQCCIWYFYLNTVLAPIETLPIECSSRYQDCLDKLFTLTLDSDIESSDATESSVEHLLQICTSMCHTCESVQPIHSYHSYALGHCALEFDHYCVFLKTNICASNYFWFFGYLISMSFGMTWFLFTVNDTEPVLVDTFGYLLIHSFKLYTLFAWLCMVGFTACQCYLLYLGETMHEYLQNIDEPSSGAEVPSKLNEWRKEERNIIKLLDRLNCRDMYFLLQCSPLFCWIYSAVCPDCCDGSNSSSAVRSRKRSNSSSRSMPRPKQSAPSKIIKFLPGVY